MDRARRSAALELVVTDTGVGIDSDDLPHIFERFSHGNGAGGSGLGLAIVKQLVEAQGGVIRAESAPGQGTTMRFTLPRAACKASASAGDMSSRQQGTSL